MRDFRKSKPGAWSIEHQIELRDIFRKIKEEQLENIGLQNRRIFFRMFDCFQLIGLDKGDIVDRILLELTDTTKTRRHIVKELKIKI